MNAISASLHELKQFFRRTLLFVFGATKLDLVRSVSVRRSLSFSTLPSAFLIFLCVSGANAQPITVVDDTQRRLVLNKPVERVIALAPHIVENVFAIGGGHKIVGVMAHSDFPDAAKSLPVVGSYASLNIEQIVGLKPDLIIAWRSGGSARALEKLVKLGYPVYFGEPKSVSGVASELSNYGLLLGLEMSANELAQAFLNNMSELRQLYSVNEKGTRKIVDVFYQIWNDPLQTIGGDHLINDVITLCGGRNIFHDVSVAAPLVSREAVVSLNPDVIVTGDRSAADKLSGVAELPRPVPASLRMWENYPMIKAVKNQHLVGLNPDWMHRHTIRIFDGAKALCEQLEQAR